MSKIDAYREKAEAEIEKIGAEIDGLKAKLKAKGADAKIETAEQMERLESHRTRFREILDDIADAGEEAWDDVEEKAEEALAGIKSGFQKLRAKLSHHDDKPPTA